MSDKGFVSLKALAGRAPSDPAAVLADIRRIYFRTTKATIDHDFDHAVELLKRLPDEETRERATVYMEGLAQLRREWRGAPPKSNVRRRKSEVGSRKSEVRSRKSEVRSQKSKDRSKFRGGT